MNVLESAHRTFVQESRGSFLVRIVMMFVSEQNLFPLQLRERLFLVLGGSYIYLLSAQSIPAQVSPSIKCRPLSRFFLISLGILFSV